MKITQKEINYLSKEFFWLNKIGYTSNIPGFIELREFLLENDWKENREKVREEEGEGIPLTRYHYFTKSFKDSKKEIDIYHSDGQAGVFLWFLDPETGTSGDACPSFFLRRQKEMERQEIIF